MDKVTEIYAKITRAGNVKPDCNRKRGAFGPDYANPLLCNAITRAVNPPLRNPIALKCSLVRAAGQFSPQFRPLSATFYFADCGCPATAKSIMLRY